MHIHCEINKKQHCILNIFPAEDALGWGVCVSCECVWVKGRLAYQHLWQLITCCATQVCCHDYHDYVSEYSQKGILEEWWRL